MAPTDEALFAAVDPWYSQLLHVNIDRSPADERDRFVAGFANATHEADDVLIDALLAEKEWRGRLVASWMIAVGRREQHMELIGRRFREAEVVYAFQGYCVAFAAMPSIAVAAGLEAYLDEWLVADADRHHDQPWVLATLMQLDRALDTDMSRRFMKSGGPWEQWAGDSGPSFLKTGTAWMERALHLLAACQRQIGI